MQSYVVLVEELFPDWQDGSGEHSQQGSAFSARVTSTLAGGEDLAPREVRCHTIYAANDFPKFNNSFIGYFVPQNEN